MAKSLKDCMNRDQVAELPRDNFSQDGFTLLCDGSTVWIGEQNTGDAPSQCLEVPKRVFDILINKYERPQ